MNRPFVFLVVLSMAISIRGEEGPPDWVRQLERFNISFHCDWDVEIHHRPNPKLAEMLCDTKAKNFPHLVNQIAIGQIAKKRISMITLDCFNFRTTLLDINLGAENCTRIYSSKVSEGSKVETVAGGMPRYFPEPMRYFGSLSVGLPQAQIIDFLPSANNARIVKVDGWPKIYELISDDPCRGSLRFFIRDDEFTTGSVERIEFWSGDFKRSDISVWNWDEIDGIEVPVKVVKRTFGPTFECLTKETWTMTKFHLPEIRSTFSRLQIDRNAEQDADDQAAAAVDSKP